ncbi:cryptochrome/photolyase family protein [Arachidicoccus ginsenosidivorans]|uniref:cryptochrome/photolyase family protein n=1 Tax=Arachidicoccus ginsenosidivorans TaxID=496057 RepID=UPI001CEF80F0|nr:deoxyribodipyrimidine photo-lyase [Arachidicoccus ginsenosidivorans]
MKQKITIFWFRRDLRLEDNVGLSKALNSGFPVLPIFIFDTNILGKLENKKDRRVDYIQQVLQSVNVEFKEKGSALKTFFDEPMMVFKTLSENYNIQAVYCNRDYEPEAIKRDTEVYQYFKDKHIPFKACKDQVIFDKNEVVKNDGTPYTVYTPYAKKWQERLQKKDYESVKMNWKNLLQQGFSTIHSVEVIGFGKTDMVFKRPTLESSIIDSYGKTRDFPTENGTTRLGMALRFGTISIRHCVAFALEHNRTWLSELIWREFFMQILYHFPKVVTHSFKAKYDFIEWRNNEKEFELWCNGKTGFPMVDAGMRELNQTGYMHNRVRMVVASFLVKDLLIDWRWGQAYFAEKLNDYDLSANNGNWQWAAGCGCDAAPYFRIFNPTSQIQKFDKDFEYIKNGFLNLIQKNTLHLWSIIKKQGNELWKPIKKQ